MKRYLLITILTCLTIGSQTANSVEIIYPQEENVTINADSTFFTGHEKPEKKLTINSNEVKLSRQGGFFYPVNLELGQNKFIIDNGTEQKTYIINREEIKPYVAPDKITYFETPQTVATIKDNVPLRSFPYDGGITRLQHFDKGMPLNIIGEYQNFYLVQLARDDYAWIDKYFVASINGYNNSPVKVEGFVYEETPQGRIFTIKVNKKVPYILSESIIYKTDKRMSHFIRTNDGLDLTVYNVKNYPENKYEIHINKTGFSTGYKSYYKNNHELVIEIKDTKIAQTKNLPLKGLNITLDAGHGGKELGAVGCLGNYEKDINLQIALKLKKYLENAGANVFMTRTEDKDVSLNDRVEFSKKHNSDIFLSIHNDSLGNGSKITNPTGSTGYVYYPQASELAQDILSELNKKTGLKNNGVNEASFAVVRNTESLSVLLEVGYMISPKDIENLTNEEFQETTAKAIFNGMEKYINDNK